MIRHTTLQVATKSVDVRITARWQSCFSLQYHRSLPRGIEINEPGSTIRTPGQSDGHQGTVEALAAGLCKHLVPSSKWIFTVAVEYES